MQSTQTENFFTNIEPMAYKQVWLCLSLMRTGAYRYRLMTPDITRDVQRVKELGEQRDYEVARPILLKTIRRLSSRLEALEH